MTSYILPENLPKTVLPCPFCCDDFVQYCHNRDRDDFAIVCAACESSGPYSSSREKAIKRWNERKYVPDHHIELDKIAKQLKEMNDKTNDPLFGDFLAYEEKPPYWEVSETTIKILKEYDNKVKKIPLGVVRLYLKIKELLDDFDKEWESWSDGE